jgi:hypothetical protein
LRKRLQPTLLSDPSAEGALLEAGIDLPRLTRAKETNVTWLRPGRISAGRDPESLAADLQLRHADDLDLHAAAAQSPAQSLHVPAPFRLLGFEAISPFGKPKTLAWLAPHFTPSGDEQRMRFTAALAAHDAPRIFDGGWMLPLGQETAMVQWVEAYRRLPATRFETLAGVDPPLVVRWTVEGDVTYAYLVNNSPWPLEATLRVEAPVDCEVQSLAPGRDIGVLVHGPAGASWSVRLEPFDLVAASFPSPHVRFSRAEAQLPQHVLADLTRRVNDLGTRLRQLANPPGWNMLANPGFEQPAKPGQIPGWLMTRQAGVDVEVTGQDPAAGRQSVSIASQGPVASLVSEWFPAPRTGRLAVLVALRTDSAHVQPPFRVGLETQETGSSDPSRRAYKWLPIGAPPAIVPLRDKWGKFIVPLDEVSSAAGTEVRIRFDLMAAGRVHVDEVQLFHLSFSAAEQVALTKIVTLASQQLQRDRLADCARLMDSYWPRFLFHHVPPGGGLAAQREPIAPPAQNPQPVQEKPDGSKVLDRLKKLKPF